MGGYYGMVFLFSLYFQREQGLTPLGTGLAFLPMTLLIALNCSPAGPPPTAVPRSRPWSARP
jgi:DHA2 family methylenomycin A resistance protein-like MFS transporter